MEVASVNPSSTISSASSAAEPRPGDPLSAEAEQILSGIPDTIGAADPAAAGAAADADPLDELVNHDIVDGAMAGKCVGLVLAGVRRIRKRDCYRLDEEGLQDLGEAWAPCLNGLWRRYAPELLLRLNSSAPDLFKAILATSFALGPMIAQDMAESRKEATEDRRVGPVRPRGPQAVGRVTGIGQAPPEAFTEDFVPPAPPARPSGVHYE